MSESKIDCEQVKKQADAITSEYEAIHLIKCEFNWKNCAALSDWQGSASDMYANAAGSMEMNISNHVSKLTTIAAELNEMISERTDLDQAVSQAAGGASGA